jgi:hypothetical protein
MTRPPMESTGAPLTRTIMEWPPLPSPLTA